jgi:predicted PurR-regulated permease PerM
MLTLPTLWNLIISTLAFFISAWYINRFLNQHGIPRGMTRGILVLVLASLAAWGTGVAADWAQETLEGSQPETPPTEGRE